MSKERFDKLIKKQLESVRPAYEPRAWDRFQKRLPLVGLWPWLLQYGGWLLSGLMLTGWLTTLYTLHENQRVLEQVGKTLTQTARPAPSMADVTIPSAEAPISQRVDTVYIVKRTIVEHRHYYGRSNQQPAASENLVQNDLSSTNPTIALGDQRTKTPTWRNVTITHPDRQPATLARAGRLPDQTAGNKSGKRVNKIAGATAGATPLADSQQAIGTNEKTSERIAASDKAAAPAESTSQRPISSDSTAQQPTAIRPGIAKSDSVLYKPKVSTALAEQPTVKPAKQSRPPFRLSSLQPRVGLESMAMANGSGIGPAIELFPTDYLGVSVGLQAARSGTENHHEPNEFNSATGKEFINQYKAYLPTQYDRIEDISIQTSIVSLPVSLKYYVPLSRQWSLLFQTGSSFDLAAYQQVRYESFFQGAEQHHLFETNARPHFFHNFMFGTGIQYRKSRISAQLSPYYLYDFRSIINTPTGSNFGVKASVWLNLFK